MLEQFYLIVFLARRNTVPKRAAAPGHLPLQSPSSQTMHGVLHLSDRGAAKNWVSIKSRRSQIFGLWGNKMFDNVVDYKKVDVQHSNSCSLGDLCNESLGVSRMPKMANNKVKIYKNLYSL